MANNRRMGRRMGPGLGSVEKANDFKGTTKKLIKDYLSKYKTALFCLDN